MALVDGSDVARVNRVSRVEAKTPFETCPPSDQCLRSRLTKPRDRHYFSERNVGRLTSKAVPKSCHLAPGQLQQGRLVIEANELDQSRDRSSVVPVKLGLPGPAARLATGPRSLLWWSPVAE